MPSWIWKKLKEVPVSKVLGQKQPSGRRTQDKHHIGGPGVGPRQGSQILWTCQTWELPGTEEHDTKQSMILRKAEVLVGQTKKVMACRLPYLVEKVPRRTQRSHDGRIISQNMFHACSVKPWPFALSMYCTSVTSQKQLKGKQLFWSSKKDWRLRSEVCNSSSKMFLMIPKSCKFTEIVRSRMWLMEINI